MISWWHFSNALIYCNRKRGDSARSGPQGGARLTNTVLKTSEPQRFACHTNEYLRCCLVAFICAMVHTKTVPFFIHTAAASKFNLVSKNVNFNIGSLHLNRKKRKAYVVNWIVKIYFRVFSQSLDETSGIWLLCFFFLQTSADYA